MNEVLIVRAEAVSALGENRARTWERLLTGETAATPITHFDCGPYYCKIAAAIDGLESEPGEMNRLPHLFQKLFKQLPARLPESCVLIGSTLKGAIDQQEKLWRRPETAERKSDTALKPPLSLAAAEFVAAHFSIPDPGQLINGACASSTIALNRAAQLIASGFNDTILVWAAEIISEFVFAGFASIKALTPDCCRPFDRQRNGLLLGEGAAALLLMSAEKAEKAGLEPLAKISGWGIANDAVHLTAPAADGRGLIKACQRALNRAGLKEHEIAAINAHGTATIHNDQMEIAAFSKLFPARKDSAKIHFHSVKGALGHTLGAAGALETTIALNALNDQCLPPTVGLKEAEDAVWGQVAPVSKPFSGDHLLLTNSGFGGVNAALILSRV